MGLGFTFLLFQSTFNINSELYKFNGFIIGTTYATILIKNNKIVNNKIVYILLKNLKHMWTRKDSNHHKTFANELTTIHLQMSSTNYCNLSIMSKNC